MAKAPLSRMPTSVSIVPPILLTLLLLILSCPARGKDVGEGCTVDNSPGPSTLGVCKLLQDCAVVYQELLAGKMPRTSCGFQNFDPIVCCPSSDVQGTSPRPTETTERTNTVGPQTMDGSRGAVARTVCAENAKAVYGLELPPVLSLNRAPVNRSRCVLKHKLIVGGEKAEPKEFPHMAAIGFDGDTGILWLCGGSLISEKIVLTAAHCTYQLDWGRAKWARVGDLNLAQTYDDAQPQTVGIVERIRHPRYKRPSEYHDIAIMKLESPVTYNAWTRPACLPVDWPDLGDNLNAVATGWGRVDWAADSGSDDLLKVTLALVPHEPCNESFFDGGNSGQLPLGIVDEWQICAGQTGKDTCQGDSGGPLTVFNTVHECMYNVIGITSLGRLCGSSIPGVYTRVYHYIPWIERTAWPEYFTNV